MNQPRVVCLIATWQDEELLAEAVASAAPHVDRVIVLDGCYAGLDLAPAWSDAQNLCELPAFPNVVVFTGPVPASAAWPGEIEKRNVLLELGRAFVPDVEGPWVAVTSRWALVLDADELLVAGEQLRDLLAWVDVAHPAWEAVPLLRFEPNGQASTAPSRLFRLYADSHYGGRSYWLWSEGGRQRLDLSHDAVTEPDPGELFGVHVHHQWDRRSDWRREAQHRWGRELARRDHGTA